MKATITALLLFVATLSFAQSTSAPDIDAYFAEISRTVKEGDFSGMAALYHPDGVLVLSNRTVPIADALEHWKPGIEQTKAGELTCSVAFRFSERKEGESSAHEIGIFHYTSKDKSGKTTSDSFVNFEMLLVKRNGKWLATMEYQKSEATLEEWEALD